MRGTVFAGAVAVALVGALIFVVQASGRSEDTGGLPEGVLLSSIDRTTADRLFVDVKADTATAEMITARTTVVQVLDPMDGKSPVVFRFIDYELMQPFSAFVDRATGKVVGRQKDRDWPDFSPAEFEAASLIALADADRSRDRDDWVVSNVTGATGLGKSAGRRCLVVFLVPAGRDYSMLRLAIVDLGLEAVVEVGP